MNLAQALHSTTRRYCQERADFWWRQALELQPGTVQPDRTHRQQQVLDCYSRSDVLLTICNEVERLDFDQLEDFENTRRLILRAGREAQATQPRPNMLKSLPLEVIQFKPTPSTKVAIDQEREAFCAHIQGLTDSQLSSTQPLPYQHVLSPEDSEAVWAGLKKRWQIKGNLWCPLSRCQLSNVIAFQADAFEEFRESVNLTNLLLSHGVKRIWELREYGIEYVQDVCLFNPVYSNYEGYWSSENLDWIVYASHEESVTIGGWLLASIKTEWPDWEKHTWL